MKPIAMAVQKKQQSLAEFKRIDLFTADKSLEMRNSSVLAQASYATISKTALKSLVKDRPEAIQLSVPYFNEEFALELVRVDVLTEDFQTYTSESGDNPVDYKKGVYYRGIIDGDMQSVVALSFFDDEMIGMASSELRGNVSFNREETSEKYLIFSDRDLLVKNPNFCSTEEPENYAEVVKSSLEDYVETRDVKCVKVYIECDYALFQNKGSVANVNNWISAVYNNVAALYANENIVTQISTTFVWTTMDSYSRTSSSNALTQFRTARPNVNGDLAHLAALGGQNIGGVAWVNALCSTYKYAYSNIQATYQNVPTYSWTVEVMTHEMGHNLGSPHTQSCTWSGGALDNCYTTEGGCAPGPAPTNGGTIMSYCHLTNYGINFNNGFGTQPGNLVRSRVNAASCLGLCATGGGSCTAPSGLAISNITNTSATASWSPVSGSTAYQLQYRIAGGTWIVLSQQTTTTANLTGLTLNTGYEVQVRTICAGQNSSYSSSVSFTTTGGGGSSCNTPTGLAASNIAATTATVSWTAVSGAVSYDLRYKVSSTSTWSTFNTTGTVVNFTNMTAGTSYDVNVRTNCAGGSSNYSATVTFSTTGGGGATYCESKGNSSTYEWIDLVKLGSINNVTGSNAGYGNFTALNTNLTAGVSNSITLSAGMNGSYREYWTVWIDYNRDGDFTDAGEKVITFNSTSTGNTVRTFTVPTTAKNGATRMRIQMKYNAYSTSCETFSYGEVEDYTVTIAGGTNLPSELTNAITEYTAYPNPFVDEFTVKFVAGSNINTTISVLDANGKEVLRNKVVSTIGDNVIPIGGTSNLAAGLYIIRLQSESSNHAIKMIKM